VSGPAPARPRRRLRQGRGARDWRDTVARLDVPVLFVAGAESELWPAGHAAAAAALAPQGASAVVRSAGHGVNMERPPAFNGGLLRFLSRVRGR